MTDTPTAEQVEELAAEIHKVYCKQYEKNFGKPYRTNGDYSLLDEPTKDYDRAVVRWHLERLEASRKEAAEYREALEQIIKSGCASLIPRHRKEAVAILSKWSQGK